LRWGGFGSVAGKGVTGGFLGVYRKRTLQFRARLDTHPGVLQKSAEDIEKKRVEFFSGAQGVWKSMNVKELLNARM
jgi:hypothetical protein